MSWKRPDVKDRMMTFLEDIPASINGVAIDLGTGGGIFAVLLANTFKGLQVHRLDIRQSADLGNLGVLGSLQSLPYRQTGFDVMVSAQVLHYIPTEKQQDTINSLLSRLAPGGILIIVEYIVRRSYSWNPYPVHVDTLQQNNTDIPLASIIYDNDARRPKYAAYYTTRDL